MSREYSVVVPAHNAAHFIGAALASVLAQTVAAREIIVVDDGSTDATARIARAAGATVVSTGQSLGPGASRNLGVSASTGEVIAFLDADDEWFPEHAEQQLRALLTPDVVFAGSDAEMFGSQTGLVSSSLQGGASLDIRDPLIAENPVIQSSVLIERVAFLAAGGYDESLRFSEDYDLWTRVAEQGAFAYVAIPTVRRRMHPAQATTRFRAELVRSWWTVRRRAVKRRLGVAPPSERTRILDLLESSARADVEWAIWTGDSAMLSLVRDELLRTDSEFDLDNRMGAFGGGGTTARRFAQDVRCASRAILQRFQGQR